MSELENLQKMLAALSPTDLIKLVQAAQSRAKEVAEELSEAKKEFLARVSDRVAGIVPPEACSVSISFDEKGAIVERRYKSGVSLPGRPAGNSTGVGSNGGRGTIVNQLPPIGTMAYRTYDGVQHTLLYKAENDFVLDGKSSFRSPTDAAKHVKGNDTNVNGRAFWYIQGTLKMTEA